MRHRAFAVFMLTAVLTWGATAGAADAPGTKIPKKAPAQGSCMPDGGCCGQGQCAQAQNAPSDKPAAGCPCGGTKKAHAQRMKKAQAKKTDSPQ